MPIRRIDPAKRGTPPVAPSVATAIPTPASRPTPGHQPQASLEASASHPDAIVVRRRIRGISPAPTPAVQPLAAASVSLPAKRAHHVVDRTGSNWDGDDYLVGRNRPPKEHQWQKGQSGNPRGPKPKEKLSPEAAFEKEVLAEFTAKVNGEEVTLNMGTFAVQLLKAGAAKGGVKAQQMLLELFMATVRKAVVREDTPAMEEWEQQLIDQMLDDYGLPAKPVFRQTDRTLPEEDPSPGDQSAMDDDLGPGDDTFGEEDLS
ncbi:hypothetical protein SAMN04488241_108145 [Sphingomonas rubra]|uniref:DUF5681 domain-containing protein n=1 Tax=Sphingomonas rubra TaxID=634430 RepID=A0A1I5TMQ7_9SPHN|nr:hypothetical protein SAMN04488241_108145 [Sphingomonas rubra]